MKMMPMKPAGIKECCENESKWQKLKIVCFSILMASIGTTYQSYFNNLVYRSGIFQQRALAGQERFTNYRDPLNPYTLAELDGHYFKPTKQWKDDWRIYYSANQVDRRALEWGQARWDEWATMHDNVIWFDTAACLDGGFIGQVNKQTGSGEVAGSPDQASENEIGAHNDAVLGRGPRIEGEFWSTDTAAAVPEISTWYETRTILAMTNDMNENNSEIYRDLIRDYIEMVDDCDVECQARGSQLTLVAGLMGTVYGLVCLNALFMFVGTWRYRWRICSVYFTWFVCMFQLCVLIATGALLDSKYNRVCMRSMTATWGVGIWTMADDFYVTGSMWVLSFFLMIGFVCCAGCQVMREKTPM
jgi:hypothetical protein